MHIWNRPWPFIYEHHNRVPMLLSVTFDEIATLVWNFYWTHKFVSRWIIYIYIYIYIYICLFLFVAVPVCGRSGLCPFRFVAGPVCGRYSLCPFRFVAFRFCAFRFVAVMTRIRPAPRCARRNVRPHSCVVACPTTASDAKTWSISTRNWYTFATCTNSTVVWNLRNVEYQILICWRIS